MLARSLSRRASWGLALTLALCAGCTSLVTRPEPRLIGPQTPPQFGQMVPTEKDKTTLPSYTIEPPDILFIEAIRVVPKPPYHIQATDVLTVQLAGGFPGVTDGGAGEQYLVDPAGRIDLGPVYGDKIKVSGLTEDEAADVIEAALKEILKDPQVSVQLAQSAALQPITGNETVLDALTQVNGLTRVSSKRIWIARPMPGGAGCDAILPVNWKEITAGAATATNYQVLPGDRIFIAEDKLIAIDSALNRMIAPFERMFGVTLLGAQAIQTINRFPFGFQGSTF